MKTRGRPAKSIDAALTYLAAQMFGGKAVSAKQLRLCSSSGLRTLKKAKKILGLESFMRDGEWHWRYPEKPVYVGATDIFSQPDPPAKPFPALSVPDPEDPDPIRMTTEDIVHLTKNWTLDGKEPDDIIREACTSAAMYPQVYPYPKEYIISVIMNELDGSVPVLKHLNKNNA